ncbi:uncharacterized protein GGS25DRAFT_507970 [Hypoxylon fragiforme]|uniref:uncharacterized protein n=1 Tax=Hypoxylon fragiforme TaxID=63214 RepID=UPI0020C6A817|nr:uncharacterized protein GGS25DRAFT_507970 [Hypoxylon fragiforme]KAI2604370.1 hypothetical protein GGS25DRAFT_507970 [Hypoxylon fragiforme]
MSFGSSFLSKMGFTENKRPALSPLRTSPLPSSEEHDLSELSPRPDDALLSPDFPQDFSNRNSTYSIPKGSSTNRKGKAIAFAYQDRPQYSRSRTQNSSTDYSAQKDLKVPPGIWRPNIRAEQHDDSHATNRLHTSLVESIFMGRPDRASDRTSRLEVDNSFKNIQRRERQMQKELQGLLDAQGAALERDLAGDDAGKMSSSEYTKRGNSPDSVGTATESKPSRNSVVPVRQPKKKPLSKRQARVGIARFVTMLADLKNEEDAYIASALAERKTALSKLRSLSSQRKSVVAEMKALEEDDELPIKVEIATMEDQHRTVCSTIERLEEKLRVMRKAKADLENRLMQARSTRDSSLSGHRGALKQCDQGISELMKYPGIQVLQVEDLQGEGEDTDALMASNVTGVEFLSLRPERRTMEMAKDWWEGEVAILEQRKSAVDEERTALEEGSEIWQQVLSLTTDFETHLNETLQVAMNQRSPASENPENTLREQYKSLKATLREVRRLQAYVESHGWNLLIAAIGAELAHLVGLKDFLAEVIRGTGYDDGSITPRQAPGQETPNGNDLVDVRERGYIDEEKREPENEELSRSVIRRWDTPETEAEPPRGSLLTELLNGAEQHRDESDNEVPPGLFNETQHHHESEDEQHNDIPVEFLSMHSSPLSRDGGTLRTIARRESSEHDNDNEVPPDLLAEAPRHDDGVD